MNHIVATFISPNGIQVKLLGETHSKNLEYEEKCKAHINDEKIGDILLENAKICKFGICFL